MLNCCFSPYALYARVFLTFAFFSLSYHSVFAQLSLDGDFRLRPEYRHGFQSLIKPGQEGTFFTSQRTRLNLGYIDERYSVRFSIQDVRTWGSQPQIVVSDALLSLHEAWIEYNLTKKFAIKAGRMELAYDNHRILGNLDWAQQGRKHDLALFKFVDSTFTVHAGLAYNQDKEQLATNLYTVPNSYKTMQFVWLNKQLKNLNLSFLFLNNGMQSSQKDTAGVVISKDTHFSQTTGFNADFTNKKIVINAFAYVQSGEDVFNRSLQAYDLNLQVGYKMSPNSIISAGAEYLSGTTAQSAEGVNRSFTPLYGTNHIFNGYMDYFYVGNHINNVGLQDIYFRLKQNLWKGFLTVDVHQFQSAAYVLDPETSRHLNKNLGTEIDLTLRQTVSKELTVQAGYSQMLATTTMEVLKGGDRKRNNDWAYLWIIFKPDFLKARAATK